MSEQPDELYLRSLFARFLENRCSEQEIRLLMEYADNEAYRDLLSGMMQAAGMEDGLTDALLYARHKKVIDAVGSRITPPTPGQSRKVRKLAPYLAAAAAALLLFTIAGWRWYASYTGKQHLANAGIAPAKHDLLPGSKKAVLILGNGASLTLDSASGGLLSQQGQTQVIQAGGGNLLYKTADNAPAQLVYNTVITPRGGQYQVTLADGTNVWLNAASSLRFPAAFSDSNRMVTLTGEAYFEVAKHPRKPFIVMVKNMQATVLGTHFNIMAYEDEATINTTLLEGSVKVAQGNASALLAPGQQAQLTGQGTLKMEHNADVNAVMAWKNQLFWFDNDDIHNVMRQLSREYDIDVMIRGNIQRHFTGSIPRNAPVSTVFRILERTGGVHFTISDGKIIVTP